MSNTLSSVLSIRFGEYGAKDELIIADAQKPGQGWVIGTNDGTTIRINQLASLTDLGPVHTYEPELIGMATWIETPSGKTIGAGMAALLSIITMVDRPDRSSLIASAELKGHAVHITLEPAADTPRQVKATSATQLLSNIAGKLMQQGGNPPPAAAAPTQGGVIPATAALPQTRPSATLPYNMGGHKLVLQPSGDYRPQGGISGHMQLAEIPDPDRQGQKALALISLGNANLPSFKIGEYNTSHGQWELHDLSALAAGTPAQLFNQLPQPLDDGNGDPITDLDQLLFEIHEDLASNLQMPIDKIAWDPADKNGMAIAIAIAEKQPPAAVTTGQSGGDSVIGPDAVIPPLSDAMKDLATAVKANPALLAKLEPELAAQLKAHAAYDIEAEKRRKIEVAKASPIAGDWS